MLFDDEKRKEVGQRIKQLAEKKGYKQTYLALELHMSVETISRVYRGKTKKLDNIKLLADYLEVDIDYLLTGQEREPSRLIEIQNRDFYVRAILGLSDDNIRKIYNLGVAAELIQ